MSLHSTPKPEHPYFSVEIGGVVYEFCTLAEVDEALVAISNAAHSLSLGARALLLLAEKFARIVAPPDESK